MKHIFKSVVAAAALSLTASAFAATPTTVTIGNYFSHSVLPSQGSGVWYQLGGAPKEYALAVEFDTKTNNAGSFASYCADLSKDLVSPGSFTFSDEARDSIARLFAVAGFNGNNWQNDGVSKFQTSALQVAIWEAVHDGLGVDADLRSGNLLFTDINAGVEAQANLYLSAASTVTSYSPIVRYFSPTSENALAQPLVTTIPEPSTYAMLAACLGVIGLVVRRKSA